MNTIRELHPKLQEKAFAELNEDPKRLPDDLKYLKEWLSKQHHINARDNDQMLVSFLRGCKFSLEKCKEKIDSYYTLKTLTPEIYENRDPLLPEIQEILSAGALLPLKTSSDPTAAHCYLLRYGTLQNANMVNIFRVGTMIQDISILEDDTLVISGVRILQDMKNIKMSTILSISPSVMKKGVTIFQNGYPLRIKGYHVMNASPVYEMLDKLAAPFLAEKFKHRTSICSNLEEVHKLFPKEVLPEEYGGTGGKLEEIVQYWKNKIESYREWFLEDSKYGTDEKKRPGKPKTTESVFGLDGSFRQLSVD